MAGQRLARALPGTVVGVVVEDVGADVGLTDSLRRPLAHLLGDQRRQIGGALGEQLGDPLHDRGALGDRAQPPCRERLGRGGERLRYLRVRGEGENLGHLASRRVGYLITRGLCHACSRSHYGKGPVRQRYGSKVPSPRPIPLPGPGTGPVSPDDHERYAPPVFGTAPSVSDMRTPTRKWPPYCTADDSCLVKREAIPIRTCCVSMNHAAASRVHGLAWTVLPSRAGDLDLPLMQVERARYLRRPGRALAWRSGVGELIFHDQVRDRSRRRRSPGSRPGRDSRRTSDPGSGASSLAGAVASLPGGAPR